MLVKRKLIFSLLILVLVLSLAIPGCAEEEKTVILGYDMSITMDLQNSVAKILLEEELGYTVEFAGMAIPAIFAVMAAGDVDVFTNTWQPNQAWLMEKYDADIDFLGLVYDEALQGWLVPTWFSQQYDITEVSDLKDPEIAKLVDVDGDGTGDLLGCDAGWTCAGITDDELAAYELDDLYEQKYGAEDLMLAAIVGRLKKNEPVLFYFWTPHQLWYTYSYPEDVVWLEDPKGFWPLATSSVIANVEWIAENPKAAELLSHLSIPIMDVGWSMAEIKARGGDPEIVEAIAREWMAAHQAEVDSWVKAIK